MPQQHGILSLRVSSPLNTCPVCGYRLDDPPENHNICPSCGTEFGFDDLYRTHEQLRARWLGRGAAWWSDSDPTPAGCNPQKQLYENLLLPRVLVRTRQETEVVGRHLPTFSAAYENRRESTINDAGLERSAA